MYDHIQAQTRHSRLGPLKNAFSYGVDFVLTDFTGDPPPLLSRNRFNLWSIQDRRHGGSRGRGSGAGWFRQMLQEHGFPHAEARLVLLTQPSFLGIHFNPVSFWIALVDDAPRAFVAEVNNTFGHRHCYFCAHDDFRSISPHDTLRAEKLMHVSPFQKVAGTYFFNLGLTRTGLNIRIRYENGGEGVYASLRGPRRPATPLSLFRAAVRRPFGAARVVALIYWQALILWFKRAPFLKTPPPPETLLSSARGMRK